MHSSSAYSRKRIKKGKEKDKRRTPYSHQVTSKTPAVSSKIRYARRHDLPRMKDEACSHCHRSWHVSCTR